MSAWRGPGDGARTEEGDQGSATVVAAVVTAALLVLGGLVLHLGGATVQRRQAAGAADSPAGGNREVRATVPSSCDELSDPRPSPP